MPVVDGVFVPAASSPQFTPSSGYENPSGYYGARGSGYYDAYAGDAPGSAASMDGVAENIETLRAQEAALMAQVNEGEAQMALAQSQFQQQYALQLQQQRVNTLLAQQQQQAIAQQAMAAAQQMKRQQADAQNHHVQQQQQVLAAQQQSANQEERAYVAQLQEVLNNQASALQQQVVESANTNASKAGSPTPTSQPGPEFGAEGKAADVDGIGADVGAPKATLADFWPRPGEENAASAPPAVSINERSTRPAHHSDRQQGRGPRGVRGGAARGRGALNARARGPQPSPHLRVSGFSSACGSHKTVQELIKKFLDPNQHPAMRMHRIVDIKVIDELVDPTVTRGPTSVHTGKFFAFVNFEDVEGSSAAKAVLDQISESSDLVCVFARGPTPKGEFTKHHEKLIKQSYEQSKVEELVAMASMMSMPGMAGAIPGLPSAMPGTMPGMPMAIPGIPPYTQLPGALPGGLPMHGMAGTIPGAIPGAIPNTMPGGLQVLATGMPGLQPGLVNGLNGLPLGMQLPGAGVGTGVASGSGAGAGAGVAQGLNAQSQQQPAAGDSSAAIDSILSILELDKHIQLETLLAMNNLSHIYLILMKEEMDLTSLCMISSEADLRDIGLGPADIVPTLALCANLRRAQQLRMRAMPRQQEQAPAPDHGAKLSTSSSFSPPLPGSPLSRESPASVPLALSMSLEVDSLSMPEEYLCPISFELMDKPVVLSDGFTYNEASIKEWIRSSAGSHTSPMTGQPLKDVTLKPNIELQSRIAAFTSARASSSSWEDKLAGPGGQQAL